MPKHNGDELRQCTAECLGCAEERRYIAERITLHRWPEPWRRTA
jgi:hypothetical protein